MSERIVKVEARFEGVEKHLAGIERRLDRIEDKFPSKWDMAQVVGGIIGFAVLLILFGPRMLAMITAH